MRRRPQLKGFADNGRPAPRGRLSTEATRDALAFEQPRQILAAGDDAWVGWVERVLEDREGAAVEGLGLIQPALRLAQQREVVERRRHFGVIGAEKFLLNLKRAHESPLGLTRLALRLIKSREVVQVHCHVVILPA